MLSAKLGLIITLLNAIAYTSNPSLLDCMTIRLLTLKSLRQSRQRYGCGLRVFRSCMS